MEITFSLDDRSFSVDAALVLLFRDNVQHHLQGGHPQLGYWRVHALADTLLRPNRVHLAAPLLWADFDRASRAIAGVDLDELAISLRTCALLAGASPLPAVRGTFPVHVGRLCVPVDTRGAVTLGDLFARLRSDLKALTRSGRRFGLVAVSSKAVETRWLAGPVLSN